MLRVCRCIAITLMLSAALKANPQQSSAAADPKATLPKVTLTDQDSGKEIDLTTGSMLIVKLPSNPSTGYRWTVVGDPAPLKLQKTSFQRMGKNADEVGAPGSDVFQLRASSAGMVTLTILYRRSWEYNIPPVKTFTVRVNVR
jgi:inhibitor of cysteine peptidase